MKLSELLRNALKLIDKPEKWTKGIDHAKRCVKSAGVAGAAKYVDCYCARGALDAAGINGSDRDAYTAAAARLMLEKVIPSTAAYRSITGFNDNARSHDTIVRWFKRAIAQAKKVEGT